MVDRDHHLVASTPAADRWLSRLPQPVPGGDSLPGFLYALVGRVTPGDLERVTPDRWSPRLRIRATDGTWLLLRATPLSESPALGHGAVAVTIEPARRGDLQHLIMRAHQLSDREREVAALVVNGLANPDIAEALFITRYTVADHLKAIYGKVGVSSRGALAARTVRHGRESHTLGISAGTAPPGMVASMAKGTWASRREKDAKSRHRAGERAVLARSIPWSKALRQRAGSSPMSGQGAAAPLSGPANGRSRTGYKILCCITSGGNQNPITAER